MIPKKFTILPVPRKSPKSTDTSDILASNSRGMNTNTSNVYASGLSYKNDNVFKSAVIR